MFALFAVFLLLNFLVLQNMLSYFDQLKTIPAYQGSLILGNLITGGIILSEFGSYSTNALSVISLGTIICVLGLYYKICFDYQEQSSEEATDSDNMEVKRTFLRELELASELKTHCK